MGTNSVQGVNYTLPMGTNSLQGVSSMGTNSVSWTQEQAAQAYRNLTGLPAVTTPSFQQLPQDAYVASNLSEQPQGSSGWGTVAKVGGLLALLGTAVYAWKKGYFGKIANWFKEGAAEVVKKPTNEGSKGLEELLSNPKNKEAYDLLIARGRTPERAEKLIRTRGADKCIKQSKSCSLRRLEERKAKWDLRKPEREARARVHIEVEKLKIIDKLSDDKKKDAAFVALKKSGMSGAAALEELKENPASIFELLKNMSLKELKAFV